MEFTQHEHPPTTSRVGKRNNAAASSVNLSNKSSSDSHLARSPASLRSSDLVRRDPMWPCFACRGSRTRCEGGFPCSRCAHYSLCCLPNNWKKEDPALEYMLTRNSPKPFADMYTQAFEKLYLANKVRRDSAITILKMWDFLSCLAGADVTLGLADHIRARFDITLLETEDPSSLSHSPPPDVRMQRLRLFQAHEAKQARTQQLKETEIYKQENEGAEASGTSLLMFVISGPSMWAASNDVYTRRMQGATELWDKALQKQLLWVYLMAPIYAIEDRQEFFDLMAEMIFGHLLVKMTMLCRIYDNDGTSKLCLSSVRNLRLGPHTTGVIYKAEYAPPSKHLTTPMGLAKVTRRVRTKNRFKVQQRMGQGGSPNEGQLKHEEGSMRSDGSVASWEGLDAGLGQGGSGSVSSISDHKTPIFPWAGLAALPFGADSAALQLPPPPPPPGVTKTTKATRAEEGAMTEIKLRRDEFATSSSSLVARAAAMPTAELEALFAKKAGGRWKIAGKSWGRGKGEEGGRGPEEQQQQYQQLGRENGVKVEPAFAWQPQRAGDEHQHYYQQHVHASDLLPPPDIHPQAEQRIANVHIDQHQQRVFLSSHAFLAREDEQVQLAHQFQHQQQQQQHQQQQEARRVNAHGQQQQGLHDLQTREGGWKAEGSPVRLLPLPSPLMRRAPVLDLDLLQDVFAEEGRAGGDEGGLEEDRNLPQILNGCGNPSMSIEQLHQQHPQEQYYLQQHRPPQQQQQPLPQPYHYQDQLPHRRHMQAHQGIAGFQPDDHHQQQQQQHHMSSAMSIFPSPHTRSPQQQQHQYAYQPAAAALTVTEKVEEGKEAEKERVACVRLLSSSVPVPTLAFEEGIVPDVSFAEGVLKGGRDGGLNDAVERGAEAEEGEPFQAIDKEVIDLFKDGGIESW